MCAEHNESIETDAGGFDVKKFKRLLRWFWGISVVAVLAFYFTHPDYFTADRFREFVGGNTQALFAVYIGVTCIRAIFFLPSTIFVFMGAVLFPAHPYLVIAISMVGILVGASLIYLAADFLKPEDLFSEKHVKKMEMVHNKMEKYGFWIVLLWSFFPAVPTDLICFVAGTIKMTYWKFILAVFIGELILVNIYVWTGKSLVEFLLGK